MSEAAVINASPLIFLAHAGQLDLLHLLNRQILVPQPVLEEISRRGAQNITAKSVAQASWLQIVQIPPVPILIQIFSLFLTNSETRKYAKNTKIIFACFAYFVVSKQRGGKAAKSA